MPIFYANTNECHNRLNQRQFRVDPRQAWTFSDMNASLTPELFTAKLEPSGQQCDAWADQTLLNSIEMGGLNWPSSCRNGTCRTCLGTLTAGSVHYKIDWPGLTAEEKVEGCVLPCVAYPDGDVTLQDPEN